MPVPGGGTKSFLGDFFDTVKRNVEQGPFPGITNPEVPVQGPQQETIRAPKPGEELNSLQELLYMKTLNPGLAKNPITGALGDAFDSFMGQVKGTAGALDDFISKTIPLKYADGTPIPDTEESRATVADKIGAGTNVLANAGGLFFSPEIAAFKGGESIPIVGPLVKGFNHIVGKGFELGSDAVQAGVDLLPLSDEAKAAVAKPIGDLTTLLAALAAGKLAHDRLPEIKAKIADIQRTVTKDIVTKYNIPETVTVSADKIRNYHEAGGIRGSDSMTPQESQAFKDLGLSGKDYVDALRNGVSISIPAEKIITIIDKPYWSKVKGLFGFESVPDIKAEQFGKPEAAPAGLVEAPASPVPAGVPAALTAEQAMQNAVAKSEKPSGFGSVVDGLPKKISITYEETPENVHIHQFDTKATGTERTGAFKDSVQAAKTYADATGKTVTVVPGSDLDPGTDPARLANTFKENGFVQVDPSAPKLAYVPEGASSAAGVGTTAGPERGTSKIAKSVEAKSVEAGLTKGFPDLAGYDKVTVKDQSERAAEFLNSDMEAARAALRGTTELPSGLKGVSLVKAFEDYALKHPDGDLAYEIANSPLITGTSEAAQELRLAAERDPDSVTSKLQEIRKAREDRAGKPRIARAKNVTRKLVEASKEMNLPKKDVEWDSFLESITC